MSNETLTPEQFNLIMSWITVVSLIGVPAIYLLVRMREKWLERHERTLADGGGDDTRPPPTDVSLTKACDTSVDHHRRSEASAHDGRHYAATDSGLDWQDRTNDVSLETRSNRVTQQQYDNQQPRRRRAIIHSGPRRRTDDTTSPDTSAAPVSPTRHTPSSHVWTADQLSQHEPLMRRCIALFLWLFSAMGNVFAVQPDLRAPWTAAVVMGVAMAIGWQVLCTLVQFLTCRRYSNPLYIVALLFSLIPSIIGYYPKIALPLAHAFSGTAMPDYANGTPPPWALTDAPPTLMLLSGIVIMIIALLGADILPERIVVKH